MKILVTGFDPFGGEKINPAIESVKKVADKITVSNTENAIAKVIYDLERGM